MDQRTLLQIEPEDTVAVALHALKKGMRCEAGNIHVVLNEDIPLAHKVALTDIPCGKDVIKYGYSIGHATKDIHVGDLVHTHNVETNLKDLLEYQYVPDTKLIQSFRDQAREKVYFEGYLRENGTAGTRNDIWIVPTVSCVNNTARRLADIAQKQFGTRVDSILPLVHNTGCSQLGNDLLITQKILKGLIENPNAGAVLVLSLGCENNGLEYFRPVLGEVNPDRVKFLVTQNSEDEYAEGMKLLGELSKYAGHFRRQKISAEKLVIGLKCGSSDPFSGITANPLCGRITDRIVRCGGSGIMTEVSEMFGAEQKLMARAVNKDVFSDIVKMINDFKSYFMRYNMPIDRNPAPGNIRSGITTDEDKSLGNIMKGGTSPIVDVLNYGDQARKNGLNLLTGSGNDPVSVTNLVASGANMVLFTTGNGNPFGAVVPTIKVSSNTDLCNRKRDWIDYNAGQLLDGRSWECVEEDFFRYILDVASGKQQTNNEKYGYREIAVFKDGVIL